MARPADAASEIRAALPATITARLDLTTLRLQPGSFVSRELRSRYSDLLYNVQFDGRDAYVYVLIEHQSGNEADPNVDLRPGRVLRLTVGGPGAYPLTSTAPRVGPRHSRCCAARRSWWNRS
ncbi:hypothetical protein GCM10011610_15150 [Nocardia rhizosphaerihabitans]|uniref:Transposase (putative) YhgA-like domain-containing protein n=2 Tax=Nocardia rhizosphaerihabitans TaxID=1691570 RepID=A0ABQ2K9G7_9NOCA|nr:hypothetical protein GCM10011610_15150 [Nocardia rhizosphaerihabitans]